MVVKSLSSYARVYGRGSEAGVLIIMAVAIAISLSACAFLLFVEEEGSGVTCVSASALTLQSFVSTVAFFSCSQKIWVSTLWKVFPLRAVSLTESSVGCDLLRARWYRIRARSSSINWFAVVTSQQIILQILERLSSFCWQLWSFGQGSFDSSCYRF